MVEPRSFRSSSSLLLVLALCVGCDDKPKAQPAATTASAHVATTSAVTPATASASSSIDRRCQAQCSMAGLCGFDQKRKRCVARDEADCRAADSCKTSGLCSFKLGICMGVSAEDCLASERCRRDGICAFRKAGIQPCIADVPSCKASERCQREGRCSVVRGKCAITIDADCTSSRGCEESGLCSAVDDPRKRSNTKGMPSDKLCRAKTNDDCKKAAICRDKKQCTAVAGFCR